MIKFWQEALIYQFYWCSIIINHKITCIFGADEIKKLYETKNQICSFGYTGWKLDFRCDYEMEISRLYVVRVIGIFHSHKCFLWKLYYAIFFYFFFILYILSQIKSAKITWIFLSNFSFKVGGAIYVSKYGNDRSQFISFHWHLYTLKYINGIYLYIPIKLAFKLYYITWNFHKFFFFF